MTDEEVAKLIDERVDHVSGAIAALGSGASLDDVRETIARAVRADLSELRDDQRSKGAPI